MTEANISYYSLEDPTKTATEVTLTEEQRSFKIPETPLTIMHQGDWQTGSVTVETKKHPLHGLDEPRVLCRVQPDMASHLISHGLDIIINHGAKQPAAVTSQPPQGR